MKNKSFYNFFKEMAVEQAGEYMQRLRDQGQALNKNQDMKFHTRNLQTMLVQLFVQRMETELVEPD